MIAATAVVATASIALAANQKPGWTYSSVRDAKESVYFEVSSNGRKVADLSAATPYVCHTTGGVGGIENADGGSAKISRKGTFKTTFKLSLPGSNKVYGTDVVTGAFLKGGREKGTVKSHFTHPGGVCVATTRSYTTTGVPPGSGTA